MNHKSSPEWMRYLRLVTHQVSNKIEHVVITYMNWMKIDEEFVEVKKKKLENLDEDLKKNMKNFDENLKQI